MDRDKLQGIDAPVDCDLESVLDAAYWLVTMRGRARASQELK
jgi:hypothetical protein